MVVFWQQNVVEPVVDEAVLGFSSESFGWVKKGAFAAVFGCLWWRGLRDEAELLAVLPRIRAEVDVADVVGWLLYYLTAAIGCVRGGQRVVMDG